MAGPSFDWSLDPGCNPWPEKHIKKGLLLLGPMTDAIFQELKDTTRAQVLAQGLVGAKLRTEINKRKLRTLVDGLIEMWPRLLAPPGTNTTWINKALVQLAMQCSYATGKTVKKESVSDAERSTAAALPKPLSSAFSNASPFTQSLEVPPYTQGVPAYSQGVVVHGPQAFEVIGRNQVEACASFPVEDTLTDGLASSPTAVYRWSDLSFKKFLAEVESQATKVKELRIWVGRLEVQNQKSFATQCMLQWERPAIRFDMEDGGDLGDTTKSGLEGIANKLSDLPSFRHFESSSPETLPHSEESLSHSEPLLSCSKPKSARKRKKSTDEGTSSDSSYAPDKGRRNRKRHRTETREEEEPTLVEQKKPVGTSEDETMLDTTGSTRTNANKAPENAHGEPPVDLQWKRVSAEEIERMTNTAGSTDPTIVLHHMKQTTVFDHVTEAEWTIACKLFMCKHIDPLKEGAPQKVVLMGITAEFDDWQVWAVFWMLKAERKTGGGFLCDDMGLGKTLEMTALWIMSRWIVVAHLRWEKEKDDHLKHLKPSTPDEPQAVGARCPTQETLGVVCLCVEGAATHDFAPILGNTLVISPKGLLDHWLKEFYKWYDPEFDRFLKMEGYIQHGETKLVGGKRLTGAEIKLKIASPDGRAQKDSGRIFILTTPISYANYVEIPTRMTAVHEWTEATENDEENDKYTMECSWRGVPWARVVRDEFHLERNYDSPTIRIFRALNSYGGLPTLERAKGYYEGERAIKNSGTNIQERMQRLTTKWQQVTRKHKPAHWGISGTPWTRSPGQLKWYVDCMQTPEWKNDPELQHSTVQAVQALDVRFKALQKKGALATMDEVQQIAIDSSITIRPYTIRRSDKSRFRGRILKEMPALWKSDVEVSLQNDSVLALQPETKEENVETSVRGQYIASMEELRASSLATLKRNRPAGDTTVAARTYQSATYRLRVCSSFPALAAISIRLDMTLTGVEMFQNKWNDPTTLNNPYVDHFDEIVGSSSKLSHISATIKSSPKFVAKTKFLIFSDFPVVAFLANEWLNRSMMIESSLFHSGLSKNGRDNIKSAYQEERDSDTLELLHKNHPRALVGTYILAEGWNLDRGNWTFIMEPHSESERELQAAKRQHRFVQRKECFVIRYVMPTLPEEKLIFDRANVGSKVTTEAMRVRITEDNQVEFVDDEDGKSVKKKRPVEHEIVVLDDE